MRKIRLGKKVSSEDDSGRCSTDPQTAVLSSNNQSDCGSSDIQTPQPSYKKVCLNPQTDKYLDADFWRRA